MNHTLRVLLLVVCRKWAKNDFKILLLRKKKPLVAGKLAQFAARLIGIKVLEIERLVVI